MIRRRPYVKGDAYMIDLKDIFEPKRQCQDDVDFQARTGFSKTYTYYNDKTGSIICILGISRWWPGVYHGYGLISPEIKKHPFIARDAKLLLETAKARRLQVYVKKESDEAVRFAEFLGFNIEGTLKSFGPEGADYYMMAKLSLRAGL